VFGIWRFLKVAVLIRCMPSSPIQPIFLGNWAFLDISISNSNSALSDKAWYNLVYIYYSL